MEALHSFLKLSEISSGPLNITSGFPIKTGKALRRLLESQRTLHETLEQLVSRGMADSLALVGTWARITIFVHLLSSLHLLYLLPRLENENRSRKKVDRRVEGAGVSTLLGKEGTFGIPRWYNGSDVGLRPGRFLYGIKLGDSVT